MSDDKTLDLAALRAMHCRAMGDTATKWALLAGLPAVFDELERLRAELDTQTPTPKWQTGEPPAGAGEVVARTVRGSGNLYVVTRDGDRGWFSLVFWNDHKTHPWNKSWEWFDPATFDGQVNGPSRPPDDMPWKRQKCESCFGSGHMGRGMEAFPCVACWDAWKATPKPAVPTWQTGTPPGTATLLLIRHGSGALPTLARKGSTGVWVGTDPHVRPGMSWEGIEWLGVG